MIQEFSVKNYLSFRDKQTISFEASSDKTYEDFFCHEVKPGVRLLKLVAFYGANASGKTNVIVALNLLREILLNPKNTRADRIDCMPFLLDNESRKKPSEFELVFYIGEIKYCYSIKVNMKEVLEEALYYYPSTQPALFFKRQNVNETVKIEFGGTLKLKSAEKQIILGNTIPNSSVVSAYSKSNIDSKEFNNLYVWLKDTLMEIVLPKTELFGWTSAEIESSNLCKQRLMELLAKADFNISDLRIEEKKIPLDKEALDVINLMGMPEDVKKQLIGPDFINTKSIDFLHKTENFSAYLPIERESHGTMRYYGLGGLLDHLIRFNKILSIDELENALHSNLVRHFLKTYLVNSTQSQLFFSTHDLTLLNDDLLRRDSIWICDKGTDGSTNVFSVFDFGLHKNTSIYNSYRIGKLGGIPKLGDIYLKSHGEEN